MLTHTVSQIDVFVWVVQGYTALHTDWLHYPLATNLWLNGFPQQCCSHAQCFIQMLVLSPFVKCWDLSLLLSLTQTLCPNQCSLVWRGSLSQAIILQVIPCLGPSKWDTSEFHIQWILMLPLRLMLTYCVYGCVQNRGQRRSAGWLVCTCNNTNSHRN